MDTWNFETIDWSNFICSSTGRLNRLRNTWPEFKVIHNLQLQRILSNHINITKEPVTPRPPYRAVQHPYMPSANQEEVPADLIPASLELKKPDLQLDKTLNTSHDIPIPPIDPEQSTTEGVPKKCHFA